MAENFEQGLCVDIPADHPAWKVATGVKIEIQRLPYKGKPEWFLMIAAGDRTNGPQWNWMYRLGLWD